MKPKILISAANGVIMKSLILELRKNFYVIGIDTQSDGDASKYCDEFYLSPLGNSKKFINFIIKLAKKVKFIFLFVDEEILNINSNRKKIKNIEDKFILSESKTINTCLNKKKFSNFFKKKKINIPSSKFSNLMLAKPIYGRGGSGIFKIKNKKDFNFFKKKKNYIVQKLIKGKEYTIDCLFDYNGKLIFDLPRERIQAKGVSIVGKVIKDNALSHFLRNNVAKYLNFYGPVNVQVIRDYKNKIWLIEINPRLSGSIEFSIKAGFNPLLYFKSKKVNFKIKYGMLLRRYLKISIK